MDAKWFYSQGEQRFGPMTLDELVTALRTAPDPHGVPVWYEGLADWQNAGSIPEIGQKLPPPVPLLRAGDLAGNLAIVANAESIARLYRRLVLLVGLQILLGFFQLPAQTNRSPGAALLSLVVFPVLLGLLVAVAVTAYKLTSLLETGVPILWAIAMFIPCINIITLLALSSKAQTWCQRYGIKVGLLGPTKESIEDLRRRSSTSAFE
jgi:uncharacterized protein DUF4339